MLPDTEEMDQCMSLVTGFEYSFDRSMSTLLMILCISISEMFKLDMIPITGL